MSLIHQCVLILCKKMTTIENRMSEKNKNTIIVKRGISGLGLFARKEFVRGDFILEYTGEIISQDEANIRGGKYLFSISHQKVIDGKERHNLARYINHSCKPNAYAELDEETEKVFIYAKKKISTGEEITYHYGKEYFEDMIGEYCKCLRCNNKPN